MAAPIKVMMSEDVVVDRGFYRVKLSHAVDAITYRQPLPMLADHEYQRVIGQVINARHDPHKNHGDIVLDDAIEDLANKDVVRQMQPNEEGFVFRKNVSVGIKPDYNTLAITERNNPNGPLITVHNWVQTELSSVAQPAIPNAGTYKIEGEDALSNYAMASWHFEADDQTMDEAVQKLLDTSIIGTSNIGGLGTLLTTEAPTKEHEPEPDPNLSPNLSPNLRMKRKRTKKKRKKRVKAKRKRARARAIK